MTHNIHICPIRLSDGSMVYDVHFRDISIPAVTQECAFALADKIAAAINDHSLDTADVIIDWQERAA